ncbi:MAG: hypothetical protein AAGI03_14740 [Pseudomonadota bacterium]
MLVQIKSQPHIRQSQAPSGIGLRFEPRLRALGRGQQDMALFLFIFAALCGLVAGFLAMMLTGIGWAGGAVVFFVTCYAVALLPVLVDLALDARGRHS